MAGLLLLIIILCVFLLTVALLVIGVIATLAFTKKEKKEHIRVTAEAEKIDAMAANGKITADEALELKQALGPIAFTQTSREPDIHIKVIGILNIVFGSLGVLAFSGLFILFGLRINAHSTAGGETPVTWAALVAIPALFILAVFILRIVCAARLMNGAPWARIAIIIFAILGILCFPIGTALGIYTLWALLFRENAGLYFISGNND